MLIFWWFFLDSPQSDCTAWRAEALAWPGRFHGEHQFWISLAQRDFFSATNSWGMWFFVGIWYGDVSIPINTIFLGEWTSIYQRFLGFTRGTRVLTHCHISSWGIWYLRSRWGPEIAKRLIHAEPWWKTRNFRGDDEDSMISHEFPWPMISHFVPLYHI